MGPMKFATIGDGDRSMHLGVVIAGDRILDLTAADPDNQAFASMLDLIHAGAEGLKGARRLLEVVQGDGAESSHHVMALDRVQLHAPIPRPTRNVFCVGMNYESHVEQNARALGTRPEVGNVPLFFTKPTTAVIGPSEPILLDARLTKKLDWEVELGVVMARGGTWIDEREALDHVFGFTLVNDVSARDLQWRTSQMFIGKGLDSYCPIGPWIVERTATLDGGDFELVCRVNGVEHQRDSTANLIFSIPRIIAELSKGLTLLPGDIIATGTPGGCGYQLTPPQFLAVGDLVECEAEGVGRLANSVAAWTPAGSRRTAVEAMH
jgi:2-keto-4-pentenoate hydratase/2-oxohepta-3-ene-1,7-dioic acid hydratase in catechol pathway